MVSDVTHEVALFQVVRKTTAKTNERKTISLSNVHHCCPYRGW